MAKKKMAEKAKIEAAPVLRAQGDNPTPVITKSYIMRDDWIDKGVVNTVAFKSVDGEVQDLLVNGEPAGGGGGTAQVTFIIDTYYGGDIPIPYYQETAQGPTYTTMFFADSGENPPITVPLADGQLLVTTGFHDTIISGAATMGENFYIIITGDCVIKCDDNWG